MNRDIGMVVIKAKTAAPRGIVVCAGFGSLKSL